MTDTDKHMTQQVALYRNLNGGSMSVFKRYGEDGCMPGYVRVSEFADVTFVPLKDDAVIADAVQSIDAQIQETYAKAAAEVQRLKDVKQQLLALTHQEAAA